MCVCAFAHACLCAYVGVGVRVGVRMGVGCTGGWCVAGGLVVLGLHHLPRLSAKQVSLRFSFFTLDR